MGEALDTQLETGREADPPEVPAPGGTPSPAETSAYPVLSAAMSGLELLITGLRAQHADRAEGRARPAAPAGARPAAADRAAWETRPAQAGHPAGHG